MRAWRFCEVCRMLYLALRGQDWCPTCDATDSPSEEP